MIRVEGIVKERRPDGQYIIEITVGDKRAEIVCYISGRWRYKYKRIQILSGDRVLIEINEYDKHKGKIIRKLR